MSDTESEGNTNAQSAKIPPNSLAATNQNVPTDSPNEGATNTIDNPIIQTSMPISIVIQSLVQNLCFNYEHDDKKAQSTYLKICDMLYSMMVIDDSYLMKEFEGIRNQCQRAFHSLLTSSPRSDTQTALTPMWSNDVRNEWSHYKREFEELAFIAGGGFGKVYRVRHKLDDTEYAVKKIFIRSNSIDSVRNYLAEVKTFASLNHSNIVQYKAAWLELGASTSDTHHSHKEDSSDDELDEESLISTDTKYKEDETESSLFTDNKRDLDLDYQQEDSSDFVISFEYSRHYSLTNSTKREKRKERRVKRNSTSEGGNAICNIEEIKRLQAKHHHPKWATLFIQMSLCHSTLKQWLENRNSLESSSPNALVPINNTRRYQTVIEILKQLLKGLEYIHSKDIVHHDVKPSNIFMQFENKRLLVQLGDFGLACPLQSSQHSLACGTRLYAAPEQLAGKCNIKSDMYSLGIVVFELTESFSTDMERITNITSLRKGDLPECTIKQQPQLAQIISQLVIRQSSARPDASTLLKHIDDEQHLESPMVHQLQTKCKEQQHTIAEKDEEILRLKEEILRLKQKDNDYSEKNA